MITLKRKKEKKYFPASIFESVAVGRAYELLFNDVMEHLRELQSELHFRYCRFHGLFADEMAVVRRSKEGKLVFQWHYIDKALDNLLSVGLKPFVEIACMPEELAAEDTHCFEWKMGTSEPKSYDEWAELVEAFIVHIISRYGLDEVKTWYFEVWNEPNLSGFWPAGIDAYFERLYPVTAFAVKRVNKDLRVGGPASAGGDYIGEMIEVCYKNKIPLDFVTTHAYPLGEQCEYKNGSPYKPGDYFSERFKEVYNTVKNSVMPDLEIHWTEWNTMSIKTGEPISFIHNPAVDMHFGGACVVRNMLKVKDVCDSAAYWVVSDIFGETGIPHSPFACTYGLMNIQGIKKATYNAYKLMRRMRGEVLDIENEKEFNIGCGIEATEENGIIRIIAYNNKLPDVEKQPVWKEELSIPMPTGDYTVSTAKIEKKRGSAYEMWISMGSPQNLSDFQAEALNAASTMHYDIIKAKSENENLKIEFELLSDEVIYLEIAKCDNMALPKKLDAKNEEAWERVQTLAQKDI